MRLVVLAAMSALGLGLLAMSGASAMPANGVAIDQAASAGQLAQPIWWRLSLSLASLSLLAAVVSKRS